MSATCSKHGQYRPAGLIRVLSKTEVMEFGRTQHDKTFRSTSTSQQHTQTCRLSFHDKRKWRPHSKRYVRTYWRRICDQNQVIYNIFPAVYRAVLDLHSVKVESSLNCISTISTRHNHAAHLLISVAGAAQSSTDASI